MFLFSVDFTDVLVYLRGDYVSVQYNDGFLPDMILLTRWGTPLYPMKGFCLYSVCSHLNVKKNPPGRIDTHRRFRCVQFQTPNIT